jgi:hypothetical protein
LRSAAAAGQIIDNDATAPKEYSDAREALKRVAAGEPLREIALSYAVDHSMISR